jgi:hypothetical protein
LDDSSAWKTASIVEGASADTQCRQTRIHQSRAELAELAELGNGHSALKPGDGQIIVAPSQLGGGGESGMGFLAMMSIGLF